MSKNSAFTLWKIFWGDHTFKAEEVWRLEKQTSLMPSLPSSSFSAIFSQFSSVTQSCLTLYDPMDWSTLGFPVHHQLLEPTQTHGHHAGEAIQSSHPHPLLLLPSIFPSIRVFSNKSVLHIRQPKDWCFSFSMSPFKEHPGTDFFQYGLVGSPCSPRNSQESFSTPQFKNINLQHSAFSIVQLSYKT